MKGLWELYFFGNSSKSKLIQDKSLKNIEIFKNLKVLHNDISLYRILQLYLILCRINIQSLTTTPKASHHVAFGSFFWLHLPLTTLQRPIPTCTCCSRHNSHLLNTPGMFLSQGLCTWHPTWLHLSLSIGLHFNVTFSVFWPAYNSSPPTSNTSFFLCPFFFVACATT